MDNNFKLKSLVIIFFLSCISGCDLLSNPLQGCSDLLVQGRSAHHLLDNLISHPELVVRDDERSKFSVIIDELNSSYVICSRLPDDEATMIATQISVKVSYLFTSVIESGGLSPEAQVISESVQTENLNILHASLSDLNDLVERERIQEDSKN